MCGANACKNGITQQAAVGAAERRISHHRHAMLLAPWQQVMFNAAVAEVVRNLISGAAISLLSTEQTFHVANRKIGHTPGPNLSCRTQIFKGRHNTREVGNPIWPMQETKIEMVSPETGEARLASARDTISGRMGRPYFGYQIYAIALTSNRAAYSFSEWPLLYTSAVSINVIPNEIPVRSASSSKVPGCLPSPRCQDPWPNAGTMVPSGNLTVRPASFEVRVVAASRVDASDKAAIAPTARSDEPSAVQSPLNLRRFSCWLFKSSLVVTAYRRLVNFEDCFKLR